MMQPIRNNKRIKITYITFDMKARGGISYYSSSLVAALQKHFDAISVIEIRNQNRWCRALAVLWSAINAPRGSTIISSHINFLRVIVPFSMFKNFELGVLTYNKEVEAPEVIPLLESIDHFFPLFQSGRARLRALGVADENIQVVHNILDPASEQQASPDVPKNFTVLSRLDKFDVMVKGIFHLLRALRHTEGVHVTIAGSGDAKPGLEAYCQRHGLSEKVFFSGFIDEQEKKLLLEQTKYFIHLSHGEGIPCIAVMEALDKGCTVILHDDGCGDVEALPSGLPVIIVNRHQPIPLAQSLSRLALSASNLSCGDQALQLETITSYYSADNVARIILKRLEKS